MQCLLAPFASFAVGSPVQRGARRSRGAARRSYRWRALARDPRASCMFNLLVVAPDFGGARDGCARRDGARWLRSWHEKSRLAGVSNDLPTHGGGRRRVHKAPREKKKQTGGLPSALLNGDARC
eukprot:9257972-Pyramimonas_sp.AAC.1